MPESRFDVVRVLGEGSIGRLLLARDRTSGREVVLKVVLDALTHSREARLAIRGEYLALSRLRHHHMVEAFDYAEPPGGAPFYSMEYVPGPPFADIGPILAEQARELLAQALEGLGFLHSRHTIHNALCPDTLRLGAGGTVKILGFGLSGLAGTRSDLVRANPTYAAPEALQGGRLDPRSDLFALGAVFYHVLTGRVPFDFDRQAERAQAHLAVPLMSLADLRPDLPPDVGGLVMQLLAGHAVDRPPGALAALACLDRNGRTNPAAEATPLGLLLDAPLVGRQPQLAELAAAMQAADAAPDKGLILMHVAGPRGSGRSRVLEAIAGLSVTSGHLVARVDAREGSRLPYGTLAAVARRLAQVPALAQAAQNEALAGALGGLDPRPAQLRAQCAWADFFAFAASHHHPLVAVGDDKRLVVVLDNFDEADEASMALLRALARRGGVPVFVVASVAGGLPEGERGVVLQPLSVPEIGTMIAGTLGLQPLADQSGPDGAELADSSAPPVDSPVPPASASLIAAFHARSGGLPRIARAMLEVAVLEGSIPLADGVPVLAGMAPESLPATLDDLGRRRLAGLPYPAWQMAEALAIAGGPQRFARLGQWLGLGDTAIAKAADALLSQGLLAIAPGGGRLADPFAEAVLLQDLPAERRAELNARIAAGIEQQGSSDETASSLAVHLAGAGDTQRSATVAVRAAGYLLPLFCLAQADRLLVLAETGARPNSPEQAAILLLRADQARFTGRSERAYSAYERALAEHPKMANRPDLWGTRPIPTGARILLSMAGCRQVVSRNQDALRLAFRAANDASTEGNALDHARAKSLLARLRADGGDVATAAQDAADAVEAARKTADQPALAEALAIAGQLGLQSPGGIAQAVSHLEEARALRERLGDWVGLADNHIALGQGYLATGQYAKAVGALERGLAKRQELGLSQGDENQALLVAAQAAYELGSLGPALGLVLELEALASKAGDKRLECQARALHARVCADLGRLAEALKCAQEAVETLATFAATEDPALDLAVQTLVIPVWLALGDCNKVHDLTKAAQAAAEKQSRPDLKIALLVAAAEAALLEGDGYRAAERLAEAQKLAPALANRGLQARLQLAAARQTLSRGNDEVAQTTLAEAQNLATACGMAAVLAQATWIKGEILAQKANHLDAARAFGQAHAAACDLGMPLLAAAASKGLVAAEDSAQAHRKYAADLDALRTAAAALPEEQRERFLTAYIPVDEDLPGAEPEVVPTRSDRILAEIGQAVAGALCGTRDLPGAGLRGAPKVLDWLLDQTVSATASERGLVVVAPAESDAPGSEDASSSAWVGPARFVRPSEAAEDAAFAAFARPFLDRVRIGREAVRVADAPTGATPGGDRRFLALDLYSVLCLPLLEGERLVGTLYLDRRTVHGTYSERDLQLASKLGLFAALTIVVGRLRAGHAATRDLTGD